MADLGQYFSFKDSPIKPVYEEYCTWNKGIYTVRCKMSNKRIKALTYSGLRYMLENSLSWPVLNFGTMMRGFEHLGIKKGGYLTRYVV